MKVQVGDTLWEWSLRNVDPTHMKTMALLLRDPNPIHFDVGAVRKLGMGDEPVNQGPVNVGYLLQMLAAWAGDVQRIRRISARFYANVFAGDSLVAGGTVTATTQVDAGTVVECQVWLEANGRSRVAEGTAEVLLPPTT